MDSFSSPSSGSSATQFNPDAFKDQLKNQLAQAYAEEFLEVNLSISFSLYIYGFLIFITILGLFCICKYAILELSINLLISGSLVLSLVIECRALVCLMVK